MICKNCGAGVPDYFKTCPACNSDMPETATDFSSDEPTVAVNACENNAEIEEPTVAAPMPGQLNDDEPTVAFEEEKNVFMPPTKDEPVPEKKKNTGLSVALAVISVIAAVSLVFNVLFATGVVNPRMFKSNKPFEEIKKDYNYETAIEIGDFKVTNAQFDYYYSMSYQYFQQMEISYQQYGTSMGFPLDKSPDEVMTGQKNEAGEDVYYDEAIADYASSLAFQQIALYTEAKSQGYTLNAEEKEEVETAISSIKKQAEEEGLSFDAFISKYYSEGLDENGLRQLFEIELIAFRYKDDLETKAHESVTDAQIEAEYKANPEEYADYNGNSADVRHCLITFSTDATDEEKKAAYDKAVKAKDEFVAAGGTEEAFVEIVKKYNEDSGSTATGGLYENITPKSNYVANFKNWAVDASRKAGDCEIVETEYGYHIMYYVKSNGPAWKEAAREKLQKEAAEAAFDALVGENGKYKMVKNEAVIEKCTAAFCQKIKEQLA